jgi:hypothetical protein
MENAAETVHYCSNQESMNNDDNDNDDDDLMSMDFPVGITTTNSTTKDSSTPSKPTKPAIHTTWKDKAIMECLEFSIEAYKNGTALKEWKAPRNIDQQWVPTVMKIPGWLKGI